MTISAISGYSPSRYDIGSQDLIQAQKDVAAINKLNVTAKDYKDAEATHGWGGIFNLFTDKYSKEALLTKQNNLEKDAEKHLLNIAAANVRRPVSPALLEQAETVAGVLQKRVDQNDNNAWQANQDDYASYHHSPETGAADQLQYPVGQSITASLPQLLAVGSKRDAIPLSDTQSFINNVLAFDQKIDHQFDDLQSQNQTVADAAKKQLLGPDLAKFDAFSVRVENQAQPSGGTDELKAAVLPNGDPQKSAYLAQDQALKILLGNGAAAPDYSLGDEAEQYEMMLGTQTPGF